MNAFCSFKLEWRAFALVMFGVSLIQTLHIMLAAWIFATNLLDFVLYSISDVLRCMGSRTDSTQSVRRLNAKRILARKLHLFGMTHAAWFTTGLGVQLLLSASRKVQENRQLMLDFTGEEA